MCSLFSVTPLAIFFLLVEVLSLPTNAESKLSRHWRLEGNKKVEDNLNLRHSLYKIDVDDGNEQIIGNEDVQKMLKMKRKKRRSAYDLEWFDTRIERFPTTSQRIRNGKPEGSDGNVNVPHHRRRVELPESFLNQLLALATSPSSDSALQRPKTKGDGGGAVNRLEDITRRQRPDSEQQTFSSTTSSSGTGKEESGGVARTEGSLNPTTNFASSTSSAGRNFDRHQQAIENRQNYHHTPQQQILTTTTEKVIEEVPALPPFRHEDRRPEDDGLRLGPQGRFGGGTNQYRSDWGLVGEQARRVEEQRRWLELTGRGTNIETGNEGDVASFASRGEISPPPVGTRIQLEQRKMENLPRNGDVKGKVSHSRPYVDPSDVTGSFYGGRTSASSTVVIQRRGEPQRNFRMDISPP